MVILDQPLTKLLLGSLWFHHSSPRKPASPSRLSFKHWLQLLSIDLNIFQHHLFTIALLYAIAWFIRLPVACTCASYLLKAYRKTLLLSLLWKKSRVTKHLNVYPYITFQPQLPYQSIDRIDKHTSCYQYHRPHRQHCSTLEESFQLKA